MNQPFPSPSSPLPELPRLRELAIGLMRGDASTLKQGYTHENAALAAIEYAERHDGTVVDQCDRELLACFAIGVAWGLTDRQTTLGALERVRDGLLISREAVQSYSQGVMHGSWERRVGNPLPAQ